MYAGWFLFKGVIPLYLEHKFVQKSILVQSGEVTGENNLKEFEKELVNDCLEDLALLESMLEVLKMTENNQVFVGQSKSQWRTDSTL